MNSAANTVFVEEIKLMSKGIDLLPAVIPGTITEDQPAGAPDHAGATGSPYIVIVYNDDVHTFEQVEIQLQKATGCTAEKAEALAIEIDSKGRAVVFGGAAEECERAANILRQIRLQVETDRT
jgi:ATP-dependent Clp protease adapter protein ClpS